MLPQTVVKQVNTTEKLRQYVVSSFHLQWRLHRLCVEIKQGLCYTCHTTLQCPECFVVAQRPRGCLPVFFLTMWTHPQRTAPQDRTSSVGVCNRRSRPLLAQFSAAIVSTANHLSPHHSVPNILPNTAAFCMSSFSRSMNLPWGPLFILPASFNILCQKYKPVHVQTPKL